MHETIVKMADKLIEEAVGSYCGNGDDYADWDMEGLTQYLERLCIRIGFFKAHEEPFKTIDKEDLIAKLKQEARDFYALREKGFELIHIDTRELERVVLLSCVDRRWMDHIDAMDELRKGMYLRSYGQHDPVVEYRVEGFEMFDAGIAAQTFCLAAWERGVGTVITGYFDEEKITRLLNLPENQKVGCVIGLGYPDEEPAAPKRKSVEDLLTYK